MSENKPKCSYCDREIKGYVETSKLNPNIKLCSNCYYIERFSMTMSKIVAECEE